MNISEALVVLYNAASTLGDNRVLDAVKLVEAKFTSTNKTNDAIALLDRADFLAHELGYYKLFPVLRDLRNAVLAQQHHS